MANIAKIGPKRVYYVYSVVINRELIGDKARTASGNLRQDLVALKRTWQIQTRRMTLTKAYDVINYLVGEDFGAIDFWIDDFGAESNTIKAYVEITEENRVNFIRDGSKYNNGRQLTLEVKEK